MKAFFADRFQNKVMLVTGGARGIGRAVALRAAREGARVVIADRLEEEGKATLETILQDGGDAVFMRLDLSGEEACKELVRKTIEKYHRLDAAINNAGVMGNPNPLHLLVKDEMDYTMANNFYSVYYCCKYELRQFLSQGNGGVIVNNASIAGITGLPGNPAYVASKHAVNGLTKNLALDYAKFNIRINSVNPAGTGTPMVEEAMKFVKAKMAEAIAEGLDPAQAQSMAGQKTKNMQEREATADEQAASVLFLASEDASHMTGAIMQTDGGWTSF